MKSPNLLFAEVHRKMLYDKLCCVLSKVDLGKINICGVLYIWYICRHLNKCCVVKLNWPNLGIGVLVEMSCFV